jgi:hypothetical protein
MSEVESLRDVQPTQVSPKKTPITTHYQGNQALLLEAPFQSFFAAFQSNTQRGSGAKAALPEEWRHLNQPTRCNMNLPAELSPAVCAWMRMQMTIAAARAVEPLRTELRTVEDFANGVFLVIAQVLPQLLKESPELAARLAPQWRLDAKKFDSMMSSGIAQDGDESIDLLEARKLLYETGADLNLWPVAQGKKAHVRAVPRTRRSS